MGIDSNGTIHIRIISNLPFVLLLERLFWILWKNIWSRAHHFQEWLLGHVQILFPAFVPTLILCWLAEDWFWLTYISNIQPCTCHQYGYISRALSRSWELISPSPIPDLWFVNLVVFLTLLNTRIPKSWNWPKCFSWQVVFEFWITSWKYYSKWCLYIEAKDLKNIFWTHAFYTILPEPLVVSRVEHNMVFHCIWWPLLIDMHEIEFFFWQHICTHLKAHLKWLF